MSEPANPPHFIYFDLGNVLLTFDHAIACRQIAELTELTDEDVRRILFDEGLQQRYELGDIDGWEFYDEFCQRSQTQPAYDALHQAGSAIFELNVPVVPIVMQLRAAGHRLGILSNTCDDHWEYVSSGRYALIPAYFEVCVLSFRVKSMKPAAKIYEQAAQLAGVEPAAVFYVDDRLENVEGAQAAGFDAIRFTSAANLAKALRQRGIGFNY